MIQKFEKIVDEVLKIYIINKMNQNFKLLSCPNFTTEFQTLFPAKTNE